jgi:hypothetical protein
MNKKEYKVPTIKIELENDIYTDLINKGVDIEMEFRKFLLQRKLDENDKVVDSEERGKTPFENYWDALDAEIKSIKVLNNKIFNK